MAYKLMKFGMVRRLADNANFSLDAVGNRDWEEYQRWLALGNTPEPVDAAPAPQDLVDAIAALPAGRRAALKALILAS
jgi:hypothetical protein